MVRHASVWPRVAGELLDVQHVLAAAEPVPWRPTAVAPNVGACVVCFARGGAGAGAEGDPAWAAAAVLRRRRLLADSVVTGAAAAPYRTGLLALREGPLLQAAVRALHIVPDILLVDA